MAAQRDIDLIDELRGSQGETTWVEFKHNNSEPKAIGRYCSALSNSARMDGKNTAYMLWGLDDNTREVLGTDFDPRTKKNRQPAA
jgi:ATP-dependent DNA helicase RecG